MRSHAPDSTLQTTKTTGAQTRPTHLWSRMAPIGWHVTIRLLDDRVIARTASELRQASRILFEQGRARGLLAFCLVDTHLHVVVVCSRVEAGRLARNAEDSLRKRLGLVPFERARFRPIVEQSHLRAAVIYVLRQAHRHGSSLDPGHDGSSLPDLLGFRVLDVELPERLRTYLPRLRVEDVAPGLVGELAALSPSLEVLGEAAAAAVGAADLSGRQSDVVAARRAAVHFAASLAGPLPARSIAELLQIDARVVRRHLREQPDARLVTAIRRQLRLQSLAATARTQDLLR